MSSPTARSLAKLRKDGWTAASVEKWNSFIKRRNDLYGFGDILAFKGDVTLIVQSTSGSNVSARVEKIKVIPAADHWLQSETRTIEVHGWAKRGARGKAKRWECRVVKLGFDPLFGPCVMGEPSA